MPEPIMIFDLDGTLSIVGDRTKYLHQGEWNAFFEACDQDEVNEPIASIYHALFLANTHLLKIVTGRCESVRQKTLSWCEDHGIYIHAENLHMRQKEDFRHDIIVKPELIEPFKNEIECIFEDRNCMVAKWRELGFCCLQVAEWDF